MRWLLKARQVDRDDAGAAVVEFVMISVLLLVLLFAVLQAAVYFYVRNVVASSAADAARFAAAENVDPRLGPARAERLVHEGLDDANADAVECRGGLSRDASSGLETVRVRCQGRLRLLFTPLGLPLTIDVSSQALREGRR